MAQHEQMPRIKENFNRQGFDEPKEMRQNQQNGNQNGRAQMMINNPVSNSVKYKTSICRHFRNGNCQLGMTCHFAHGPDEMRQVSDPLPQSIPQQPKVICNNFKTVKCRYFEKGFCKNQHACCFAHGDGDLSAMACFSNNGNSIFQNGGMMPMSHQPQQQHSQNPSQQQLQSPQQPQQQQPNNTTDSILLISILQNLEHVFPTDQQIQHKLQYAQLMAKQCDQKGAFNIISDIMKDPRRTDEEKSLYNTIYTNAQMFYSQHQLYSNYIPFYSQMGMALQNNNNNINNSNNVQVDSNIYLQQQQQQQQYSQQQQQQQQMQQVFNVNN